MKHSKTKTQKRCLHEVVIILIILVTSPTTTKCEEEEEESLIQQTCKRTPKYELCVSCLESKAESSEADLEGIAHIMAEIVLSKASETLEMIRAMLKKEDPNSVQKSLAFCAELYIPVVKYSLPQAIDALKGGHFGFANYGISDVAKQANACDKAIASAPPLADRNALLTDLSLIASAIVDLLLKGP